MCDDAVERLRCILSPSVSATALAGEDISTIASCLQTIEDELRKKDELLAKAGVMGNELLEVMSIRPFLSMDCDP